MRSQAVNGLDSLAQIHQTLQQGLEQATAACQSLIAIDQTTRLQCESLWQQVQATQTALERYIEALQQSQQLAIASDNTQRAVENLADAAATTPPLPKVITDCQPLFEASKDAIMWLENGAFIECNHATLELMGYAHKAELLGKSPGALSPEVQPDGTPSLQKAQEIFALVMEQGNHRFEWMHQRVNGERFWVEVLLTAIASNGRQLIQGIWRDITDYKAAEAELSEQEQLLRCTYDGVEHSIMIIDVLPDGDFRLVDWNPATARNTGLSSTAIAGKTLEAALGTETGAQARQRYQQCIAADATITYEELIPFQGQDHWWLTTLNPLKDKAGNIYRIVLTTFEISERKATEAALQQKEAQYRSIFESINDGILIHDLDADQLLSVNPATCKMHGYTYEEFMQLSPPDYVHPDSFPAFGQFTEAIRAGQKFTCEAVDFHKDGTLIPIEVTGVPFCYGNRLCALAVVRDISEKKRHDAARKAAAVELAKPAQFLRST